MTTRRTILTRLAAVPLAPVHAVALTDIGHDPIFAAIEAHRVALNASEKASAARAAVEQPMIGARDRGEITWDQFHGLMDDPTFIPLVDRGMAAMEAEENAFQAMLATVPTTEPGRRALARYGCELEAEDGPPCCAAYCRCALHFLHDPRYGSRQPDPLRTRTAFRPPPSPPE
jgi:hypothetical protein